LPAVGNRLSGRRRPIPFFRSVPHTKSLELSLGAWKQRWIVVQIPAGDFFQLPSFRTNSPKHLAIHLANERRRASRSTLRRQV